MAKNPNYLNLNKDMETKFKLTGFRPIGSALLL